MKLFTRAVKLWQGSGITGDTIVFKPALITVAVVVLTMVPWCHAQVQPGTLSSAIELARTDMASERNAIICAAMQLSDKDAAAFWPVYRRYEYERSVVDDGRASVIQQYAQRYSTLSEADAKSMTNRMLEYDAREIALKRKYFKEFSKVLQPITVAKFFQLDHRVDILMEMKIEASLPPLDGPPRSEDSLGQQNSPSQKFEGNSNQ